MFRYIVDAVALIAREGWRLLPDYRFDRTTGLWRHREGPVEPPLRLSRLHYDADGVLRYPRRSDTAPESALAEHLDEAVRRFAEAPPFDPAHVDDLVSDDFEHLRWFELPRVCLED